MAKNHKKVSCITPELYAELKAQLHSPADDENVRMIYGISDTTCRAIRNTKSYSDYRERVNRRHSNQNMRELDELIKNAKYDRCEYPEINEDDTSLLARLVGFFLLACLLIIAGSLAYAAVRWAAGV